MAEFKRVVELVGMAIDGLGVLVIVAGVLVSSLRFLGVAPPSARFSMRAYRQSLGRVILLGLELLVAADIIRTVAVAPTLANVAVLGLVVLIRTFLSFSLQVELEGRWPWQRAG